MYWKNITMITKKNKNKKGIQLKAFKKRNFTKN